MLENFVIPVAGNIDNSVGHIKNELYISYFGSDYKQKHSQLGIDCEIFEKQTLDGRLTTKGMLFIDVFTRWKVPIQVIYSALISSKCGQEILEYSKHLDDQRCIKNKVIEECDDYGNSMIGVIVEDRKSIRWHKPGTISSVIRLDKFQRIDSIAIKLFDAIKLFRYYGEYIPSDVTIERETDLLLNS